LQEVASFINTIAGTAVQTIGQIQVLRQQPANLNTLAALQAQRTGVPQTAREPADESIRKVLLIGAALVGAVALYQWLQSRKRDS
jgi:fatty acid desaturase